jgi:hypothetical protein
MAPELKSAGWKPSGKLIFLGLLTVAAIAGTFMLPPIPQSLAYHHFADQLSFAGIQHCWNVCSNIPFVLIGIYGLYLIKGSTAANALRIIYAVLFAGIVFTGLGSAWYHYQPDNNTLVYDRIPMTIVFMSLLCATIAEFINAKIGVWLLTPLMLMGIGSVLWWHFTELQGAGDLRLYGLVQFYPMLLIPLILVLFPSEEYDRGLRQLILVVVWYIIAKVCEHYDQAIYTGTGFISGHTLKHLAAAVSTWYLVQLFRHKYVSLLPGAQTAQ